MKKVIFIGSVSCGKTTLSQCILGEELVYKKTQSIEVLGDNILDTPGEYLERASMRGAIMVTSADSDLLCFVVSAVEVKNMFPPYYAGSFAKPVVGVLTKIDIATPEQIRERRKWLVTAGVEKIFLLSCHTREGVDEFIQFLND